MSQARCYSIIGDSNVHRNVTKTSIRANPMVKAAQVIPCGHLAVFSEALSKIRAESTVCIVACLTNFVASADGNSTCGIKSPRLLSHFGIVHFSYF